MTEPPDVSMDRPFSPGATLVDVRAYAGDCRIAGRVDLGGRRLTDLLNASEELALRDVRLESLDDGHVLEIPEVTVGRDELIAVVAPEPRGDTSRRLRTHPTPVEADAGPYHVRGWLHGTAASDPLESAVRRQTWLPLTDATIGYSLGGQAVSEEVGVLVVNRAIAGSLRAVEEEMALLPWERNRERTPPRQRVVDLTGSLRDPDRPPDDEPLPTAR